MAVRPEEQGAAFLPLEALLADGGRAGRAVVAGLRVGGVGPAGRVPAVVFDPVRDRVAVAGWLVAGLAEPSADLADELLPLLGVARGKAAPSGCADDAGEVDGFGVGGGEYP